MGCYYKNSLSKRDFLRDVGTINFDWLGGVRAPPFSCLTIIPHFQSKVKKKTQKMRCFWLFFRRKCTFFLEVVRIFLLVGATLPENDVLLNCVFRCAMPEVT